MARSTKSSKFAQALEADQRRALDGALRSTWNLGANFIIGWRSRPKGIQLLYLPSHGLPDVGKNHPHLLGSERRVASERQMSGLVEAGCKLRDVDLPFDIPLGPAIEHQIDEMLRYYTVTQCECRAVSLFDIVNFSMHSAFDQITQLNMLTHYVNTAAARCQKLEMPIDLRMSTTGDGFYLWNRETGLAADLALYSVTMLALFYNSAAHRVARTASVPHLRCCLHFGRHFELFQPFGGRSGVNDFIVGEVTISLARMISTALPRQTLIGSYFRRIGDADKEWRAIIGGDNIDTPSFIVLAQSYLDKLAGLKTTAGDEIAGIKAYLTGNQVSDSEFSIKRYCVVDKHGLEHRCFNAKFNVATASGDTVHVGLLDSELESFNTEHEESNDIRVRVV
jgi:hypothetical protein